MFEGDLEQGELEIGQVAALIHKIQPAAEIIRELIYDFIGAKQELNNLNISI